MDSTVLLAILLPIGIGILYYILYIKVLHKIWGKMRDINPIFGLGFFYFVLWNFDGYVKRFVPKSWFEATIPAPFKLDGTIGFFLHLDKETMSPWDISMATLSILIVVSFFSTFLFNKFWWNTRTSKSSKKPKPNEFGGSDWDPIEDNKKKKQKKKNSSKQPLSRSEKLEEKRHSRNKRNIVYY
jgi:hypothetical protein